MSKVWSEPEGGRAEGAGKGAGRCGAKQAVVDFPPAGFLMRKQVAERLGVSTAMADLLHKKGTLEGGKFVKKPGYKHVWIYPEAAVEKLAKQRAQGPVVPEGYVLLEEACERVGVSDSGWRAWIRRGLAPKWKMWRPPPGMASGRGTQRRIIAVAEVEALRRRLDDETGAGDGNHDIDETGDDPWLDYDEAAKAAGVSDQTWKRWTESGKAPAGTLRKVLRQGYREVRFWRQSEAVALRRPKVGDEGWLSKEQAAEVVGVHPEVWRKWAADGKVPVGVSGEGDTRSNGARGARVILWRKADVERAAKERAAFVNRQWPPEGYLLRDEAAAYLGMAASSFVAQTAKGDITYRGELRRGPNGPDCRLYKIVELGRVKRELAEAAAQKDRVPDGWLDYEATAAFFGIGLPTLSRWRQDGKLPQCRRQVRSNGSQTLLFEIAYLETVKRQIEEAANRPTAPEGSVTLAETAERLGVEKATVTKWEHDGRLPRATVVPIPGTGTRTKVYPEGAVERLADQLREEAANWPPRGWLTVDQAAERAGVSNQTWRLWGQDGRYTFGEWRQKPTLVGRGRCKLYRVEDVERFVATLPEDHWLFLEFDEKRLRWVPPVNYVFNDEAAEIVNVSTHTFKHWQHQEKIECGRLARVPPGEAGPGEGVARRVYPVDELERLAEERERNGRPYADPDDPTIARVPIMRYSATRFEATIDIDDLPAVEGMRWNFLARYLDGKATREGHVCKSSYSSDQIPMARMLLGLSYEDKLTYRDGDPLNCRRANLMVRDQSEVIHGNGKRSVGFAGTEPTSRYKGVSWSERQGKWIAQIARDGVCHRLGTFDDELSAAEAYDEAAAELYDEQARRNFFTDQSMTWVERRAA